jgi:hypothetical protein
MDRTRIIIIYLGGRALSGVPRRGSIAVTKAHFGTPSPLSILLNIYIIIYKEVQSRAPWRHSGGLIMPE